MANNNYIITGGPGSGKTSLINELSNRNFLSREEISRLIIIKYQKQNIKYIPKSNFELYFNNCYNLMQNDEQYKSNVFTFFDRGIPDLLAYAKHYKFKPQNKLNFNFYNKTVFICPPWLDIYKNDHQRPESFDFSQQLYFTLIQTYKTLGYSPIVVPRCSIQNRTDFIIEYLSN